MALLRLVSSSFQNSSPLNVLSPPQPKPSMFIVQCKASNNNLHIASDQCKTSTLRRSANYKPSSWSYEQIQTITSEYGKKSFVEERDELKAQVRMTISLLNSDLDKIEFIDVLQKLGLSHHFVLEIQSALQRVYAKNYEEGKLKTKSADLHTIALQFRILRQHGFDVSSELFTSCQDEKGNFDSDDTKGMLSLYEASLLSMEGETILDEARDFCSLYMKQYVKENKDSDDILSIMISHALELPLHWRIPRLEAAWFIGLYQRSNDVSHVLLKLACLDFNVVQVTYQQDLKYTSSWWKEMRDGEKLSFVRDMPTENFFWSLGMASHQPELSYFRREMTKITSFITILDDIYDVYGTLEELKLFTHVVHRWDIHSMDILPSFMKVCFLGLYNSVNEVAFAILKRTGIDIIPYLKKVWGDLCEAYMKEATWYNTGHVPSMQEYLDNAWISVGGPVALVQGYFLQNQDSIRPQDFKYLQEYSNIIRLSSTITRIANDLASYKIKSDVSKSSSDEFDGNVPKSLKCFMKETGASENEAYEYVHNLMCQTWKKLNEAALSNSEFSQSFTEIAMNLARMAQYMYQHGDGHSEDSHINLRMVSLLHHPVDPITYICTY